MEAVCSSEKLVTICWHTWHHIPENQGLDTVLNMVQISYFIIIQWCALSVIIVSLSSVYTFSPLYSCLKEVVKNQE
jgi:hypothetical protein